MAISRYELKFMEWVFEIMNHGFYQKNERTGIATKRISHMVMGIDCAVDCPVLKAKKTNWDSAVEESLWIFRDGSNNIHDLRPHIWDEWADENGIVQKTYGYQVKKFDQVNRVLNDLARDPSTRRAVIDLWNNADLAEMAITPCVYTSVWDVVDGKLNVLVTSRSCDLIVGGVFNLFQYTVLCKLFARHLGVEPGIMTFVAADVHIYENQFEECNLMLKQYQTLLLVGMLKEEFEMRGKRGGRVLTNKLFKEKVKEEAMRELTDEEKSNPAAVINHSRYMAVQSVIDRVEAKTPDYDYVGVYECEPQIVLSEKTKAGDTNFFNTDISDVNVIGYQYMPFIKTKVAV